MQDLKIGIVQANLFWEDKKKNFDHLEDLVGKNLEKASVDLLILPEMFSTGFSMNTTVLAEDMSGDTINWMKKMAQQYDCQVSGSFIVRCSEKFYNRFVICSGDRILSHYDKRHLFRMANEHLHFSAGENKVIHILKDWKICLQVCYDLRFPVFARNKFENGVHEYDAIVYIANWPERRATAWNTLLPARAIENLVYSIGVNRVGTDGKEINYCGDSAVYDPWGNLVSGTTKNEEQVKILTLSAQLIIDTRTVFPVYLDAD